MGLEISRRICGTVRVVRGCKRECVCSMALKLKCVFSGWARALRFHCVCQALTERLAPNGTQFEPQRASLRAGTLVITFESSPHASAVRRKTHKVSIEESAEQVNVKKRCDLRTKKGCNNANCQNGWLVVKSRTVVLLEIFCSHTRENR